MLLWSLLSYDVALAVLAVFGPLCCTILTLCRSSYHELVKGAFCVGRQTSTGVCVFVVCVSHQVFFSDSSILGTGLSTPCGKGGRTSEGHTEGRPHGRLFVSTPPTFCTSLPHFTAITRKGAAAVPSPSPTFESIFFVYPLATKSIPPPRYSGEKIRARVRLH